MMDRADTQRVRFALRARWQAASLARPYLESIARQVNATAVDPGNAIYHLARYELDIIYQAALLRLAPACIFASESLRCAFVHSMFYRSDDLQRDYASYRMSYSTASVPRVRARA